MTLHKIYVNAVACGPPPPSNHLKYIHFNALNIDTVLPDSAAAE